MLSAEEWAHLKQAAQRAGVPITRLARFAVRRMALWILNPRTPKDEIAGLRDEVMDGD